MDDDEDCGDDEDDCHDILMIDVRVMICSCMLMLIIIYLDPLELCLS